MSSMSRLIVYDEERNEDKMATIREMRCGRVLKYIMWTCGHVNGYAHVIL